MNYIHYIRSPLVNGSHYGNRGFASPMKELNDQTVLVVLLPIFSDFRLLWLPVTELPDIMTLS